MPRYFVHLYDEEVTRDEEGVALADDEAAVALARREARMMAAEAVKIHGRLVLGHKLVVTNQAGDDIAEIRFRDVVAVVDDGGPLMRWGGSP